MLYIDTRYLSASRDQGQSIELNFKSINIPPDNVEVGSSFDCHLKGTMSYIWTKNRKKYVERFVSLSSINLIRYFCKSFRKLISNTVVIETGGNRGRSLPNNGTAWAGHSNSNKC